MYHMNTVNLFFGDVILVVILSKQVVNNGLIQNLKSKIEKKRIQISLIGFFLEKKILFHSVFHHQNQVFQNVSVHIHMIK